MLAIIGLQILSSSALAAPANYNIKVCNKSGSQIYVGALLWEAQYNRKTSRGWWILNNNSCMSLNNVMAVYAENNSGRHWPQYPYRSQQFCISSDGSEFHVGYQATGPCIGYKQKLITGERPSAYARKITFK